MAAALAASALPAAAQLRVEPLLERLLREPTRLSVRPGVALLPGGVTQQRLGLDLQWMRHDSSAALMLFGAVASAGDVYSRSGLRAQFQTGTGGFRTVGAATVAAGSGAGPRQTLSIQLAGGWSGLTLEVRSTWLQDTPDDSSRAREHRPFAQPVTTRAERYTDGEVHGARHVGRVGVQLVGGLRFGGTVPAAHWLHGGATVPVWRRLSLVANAGTRPHRPDLAQIGGRFAQLLVQLDVGSSDRAQPVQPPRAGSPAVQVVTLGERRFRIRFLTREATSVELKGDLTDWAVVRLRRAPGQYAWEHELTASPGIYHVNLRIDGGPWTAPEGIPAIPDRFGGTVGVLVLPDNLTQPATGDDHGT